MTASNASYYEERRRRSQIADEEWKARQPYGAFTVSAELESWAREVVGASAASGLPIGPSTAAAWGQALGVRDERPSLYLGNLLNAIVAGAQRDGMLTAPEPGTAAIAYAHRDPATEEEVALGWGFKPANARYLVLRANTALDLPEVAGGPANVGAGAVAGVVRAAAVSLSDCRPGPEQSMQNHLPIIVAPTRWTPGSPAPR